MFTFDLEPTINIDETLVEAKNGSPEGDYVVFKDGNGYEHKVVNYRNKKYCSRDGIVELEAMRKSNKHGNNKMFRKCVDKNTGLIWGLPTGINPDTKELQYKAFWIEDKMTFDLRIPDQAIAWAIIKNSPFVEGSPNQHGKSVYKVIDREKSAAIDINKRSKRRKAEDIIESLKGEALLEMAYNVGINVDANRSLSMLTNELYRKADLDPDAFLKLYNDPNKEYVSVFNKGVAKGIITHDVKTSEYLFGSLPMGTVKEAAIKFLVDNSNIAAAISHKCDDLDQRSLKSMNKTAMPSTDEAAELRRKVMELENKLKEKQPQEEVKFNDQFSDMEDLEFNELKAKGKEYKISGYNLPTMTKEKLKAKVDEYEAKLESKK